MNYRIQYVLFRVLKIVYYIIIYLTDKFRYFIKILKTKL